MNDRELLESAAKAAGIEYIGIVEGGKCTGLRVGKGYIWNPLSDDGDAFRLAAELGLIVEFDSRGVFARTVPGSEPSAAASAIVYRAGDHLALVRRAIVRAAAALARRSTIASVG